MIFFPLSTQGAPRVCQAAAQAAAEASVRVAGASGCSQDQEPASWLGLNLQPFTE